MSNEAIKYLKEVVGMCDGTQRLIVTEIAGLMQAWSDIEARRRQQLESESGTGKSNDALLLKAFKDYELLKAWAIEAGECLNRHMNEKLNTALKGHNDDN